MTKAMVEAGRRAVFLNLPRPKGGLIHQEDLRRCAEEVYRAMELERRRAGKVVDWEPREGRVYEPVYRK